MRRAVTVGLAGMALSLSLVWASGVSAAAPVDTDGDGLTDQQEALLGTDPHLKDTDGDGYPDGVEVNAGYSPTSTSSIPMEKTITIDLKKQQLHQTLGGIAFTTFSMSSGKPGMRTPTGTFHVMSKNKRAWSNSAKLWMPFWMQFTKVGNGIHELPEWPNGAKEGANHLGTPVSHGCVRLGIGPAKSVYEWTPVGTKIIIQ